MDDKTPEEGMELVLGLLISEATLEPTGLDELMMAVYGKEAAELPDTYNTEKVMQDAAWLLLHLSTETQRESIMGHKFRIMPESVWNSTWAHVQPKPKRYRILKNAAQCNHCKDIIESTHVHDFVTCKCGKFHVDGGHDYLKRCGDLDNFTELEESVEIE